MVLFDSLVNANFRTENVGRVVVFPGDRRHRGFIVKSQVEEQKIRSFLKMFFCTHLSILVLGCFLASGWSSAIYNALGRPATHLFRAMCIPVGGYLLVVGLPYFLLWTSYKKAFVRFVSPEDEILVTGRPARRQYKLIAAGLILLGMAILLAFVVSDKP